MNRPQFVAALTASATWGPLWRSRRVFRWSCGCAPTRRSVCRGDNLRQALARHGLLDGRDYRLALKDAGGENARFQALGAKGAAVIVAFDPLTVRAAASATETIPVVGSLIEQGFVARRSRPHSNGTDIDLSSHKLDIEQLRCRRIPRARCGRRAAHPSRRENRRSAHRFADTDPRRRQRARRESTG